MAISSISAEISSIFERYSRENECRDLTPLDWERNPVYFTLFENQQFQDAEKLGARIMNDPANSSSQIFAVPVALSESEIMFCEDETRISALRIFDLHTVRPGEDPLPKTAIAKFIEQSPMELLLILKTVRRMQEVNNLYTPEAMIAFGPKPFTRRLRKIGFKGVEKIICDDGDSGYIENEIPHSDEYEMVAIEINEDNLEMMINNLEVEMIQRRERRERENQVSSINPKAFSLA